MRDTVQQTRDWSSIESWFTELSGVTVCRPILLWYNASLCWDAVHLNTAGLEKFMLTVAADLRAALEGTSTERANIPEK
jgi:hypothetical protein